jgi:thymidylate synthase
MDELYPMILEYILEHGDMVSPRGLLTREVRPLSFTLTNPLNRAVTLKERKMNHAFGLIEALQFTSGTTNGAQQIRYNSNIKNWVDPISGEIEAAYGVLTAPQVPYVIETLTKDPDSRQAILSIYNGQLHQRPMLNVPCTCTLQFFLRQGALELVVYMRSNDVWWGTPYDVFQFTAMQEMIACALGARLGKYTHTAGSSHVYEPFFESAATLIHNHGVRDQAAQSFIGQDPLFPTTKTSLVVLRNSARAVLVAEVIVHGSQRERDHVLTTWNDNTTVCADPFNAHIKTLCEYQDSKIIRRK